MSSSCITYFFKKKYRLLSIVIRTDQYYYPFRTLYQFISISHFHIFMYLWIKYTVNLIFFPVRLIWRYPWRRERGDLGAHAWTRYLQDMRRLASQLRESEGRTSKLERTDATRHVARISRAVGRGFVWASVSSVRRQYCCLRRNRLRGSLAWRQCLRLYNRRVGTIYAEVTYELLTEIVFS